MESVHQLFSLGSFNRDEPMRITMLTELDPRIKKLPLRQIRALQILGVWNLDDLARLEEDVIRYTLLRKYNIGERTVEAIIRLKRKVEKEIDSSD